MNRCETCYFWLADTNPHGRCRRHPPGPFEKYKALWPVTMKDDGCGDYECSPDKDEAPTHEEIMTKWWHSDNGVWIRVESYFSKQTYPYRWNEIGGGDLYYSVSADFFAGRESADIPPG